MKKIFLLIVFAMILCPLAIPSYAEEKKIEIRDGVLYFPEKDYQTVVLSKLTLNFPPDCPQELLNIKGKIFRGELSKSTGRMTYTNLSYLIPTGYNSETKEMTVYLVLEKGYGKDYQTKPVQGWLKGLFDLQNGSDLKWEQRPGSNIMTQEYRLHFLKNENLRINRSDGFSADYRDGTIKTDSDISGYAPLY
jgi:hypothetical protein